LGGEEETGEKKYLGGGGGGGGSAALLNGVERKPFSKRLGLRRTLIGGRLGRIRKL